ncbi:hypothetical protein QE377_000950 [Microbacterium sp. SORGH_AS 862]|nr:hypothetical protein [Microbacterium sp. SORGH_AS_0862]
MRRRLLPLALIAAGALALVGTPAHAAEPLRTVTGVAGTAGGVERLALSPDGSTGYIVDGSSRVAIFDTATSAVVAHSVDFTVEGFGVPTDVALSPDGSEVDVSTTTGWIVRLDASGALVSQIALPGTALGGLSIAAAGQTVVAAPSGADPTRILRFNLGVSSVSGIDFAPDTPSTPRPSAISDIAVGVGNGSDNDVLVAGAAAGTGVLYLFNDPFALGGQAASVILPGTSAAGRIAMNPAGTLAAVTAGSADRVFFVDIDAASPTYATIVGSAGVPHAATAANFSPDGANLFVVGGNSVSTLDVATGAVSETTAIDLTDATDVRPLTERRSRVGRRRRLGLRGPAVSRRRHGGLRRDGDRGCGVRDPRDRRRLRPRTRVPGRAVSASGPFARCRHRQDRGDPDRRTAGADVYDHRVRLRWNGRHDDDHPGGRRGAPADSVDDDPAERCPRFPRTTGRERRGGCVRRGVRRSHCPAVRSGFARRTRRAAPPRPRLSPPARTRPSRAPRATAARAGAAPRPDGAPRS